MNFPNCLTVFVTCLGGKERCVDSRAHANHVYWKGEKQSKAKEIKDAEGEISLHVCVCVLQGMERVNVSGPLLQ